MLRKSITIKSMALDNRVSKSHVLYHINKYENNREKKKKIDGGREKERWEYTLLLVSVLIDVLLYGQ